MQNILKKIKLLALDVDGVLTDGRIIYNDLGQEFKCFNAKDGQGLVMLSKINFNLAIITARASSIVTKRAEDLNIKHLYQGVSDKGQAIVELAELLNLNFDEIAYIGDDLPDIPVLQKVGLKCCPNNAVNEVKKICNFISKKDGGCGAVREVTDLIYPYAKLRLEKKTKEVDLPTFN